MSPSATVVVVLSGLVSWLLGWAAYWGLAAAGVVDRPNDRSSHVKPTVRGAGIAIIATVLGFGGWLELQDYSRPLLTFLGCAFVLAIVSFIDDLKTLGAATRFGCHFVAAVLALQAIGVGDLSWSLAPGDGFPLPVWLGWLVAFLWIAGYTNAFNFMDGINGIAAGQAAITGLGMALLGGFASDDFSIPPVLLSLVVADAALGFLPHNFPKARMFMGDVGSAPLGFLLAVLALWLAKMVGWWLVIPLALLHANFVLDTGITLVRRMARGERWREPHREHFYQRLIRSGKSHTFVTGWEMGLQALVLGLMVAYLQVDVPIRMALVGLVFLIWLSFFAFCERSFRRTECKAATSSFVYHP